MFGNARFLVGAAAAAFVSCAPTRGAAPPAENQPSIELVETSPLETSLRHSDMPQAKDVWMQMIQSSASSIDFAEFYASNAPGTALERIVEAIESAADRGVRVRFLLEEKFYQTYPETLRSEEHTSE